MKKLVMLACIICLLFSCTAQAIANPWLDLTYNEFILRTGVTVCIPESVEAVAWRYLPAMELAEVQYVSGGIRCVFRAMPSAEWEDISGLYYDPWDVGEACVIAGSDGLVCRDAEGQVSLCLWHDGARMYSFAMLGEGADAADVAALAEMMVMREELTVDTDAPLTEAE